MKQKTIKQIVRGQRVSDGAGVSINRIIGSTELNNIDPFFLLDEFGSDNPDDYIAGFPMHPHRGIETITYLIDGQFRHRDSRGGGGLLRPGDVQWMTAGKGIQHEEMPMMEEGRLRGYQLWLNLPKKLKWVEPKYQHLDKKDIPVVRKEGMEFIIISGRVENQTGPAENHVPSEYYDVRLKEGVSGLFLAKKGYHTLIYIHSGSVEIDEKEITTGHLVEFEADRELTITAGDDGAGFLFMSAAPNNEPYARGGPFVMNTREEIQQAFEDYRKGRLF